MCSIPWPQVIGATVLFLEAIVFGILSERDPEKHTKKNTPEFFQSFKKRSWLRGNTTWTCFGLGIGMVPLQ
jgi:hypothetical protein